MAIVVKNTWIISKGIFFWLKKSKLQMTVFELEVDYKSRGVTVGE